MTFPRRAAAITGVYTTVQGKKLGRTEESLKLEAIKGALADSGLSFADVDGIVPMESSMHGPGLVYHMQWAEQLGGRPLGFMGIGQASAGVAKAAAAIDAGMAEVVVIFWESLGRTWGWVRRERRGAVLMPLWAARLSAPVIPLLVLIKDLF